MADIRTPAALQPVASAEPGRAAPPSGQRLWFITLFAMLWLALFGAQWFRVSKDVAGARRALGVSAETAYVPPVPVLRMVSLGHQSFLADLLFVRATHYFVDHLVGDSRLPWLELYLNAIWGLDAHNRSTYRWGSQVVKFGQRIDREVAQRANRFARLGLEAFPDDPWLYHEIAFNLRHSMEPRDAAEAAHFKHLALQYLEIAYSFPSFQYDPNYLASQYSRAGRDDDSVRAALANYSQATEEQQRELRGMLEDRNKKAMAAELAWYDVMRARDWPYVPPALAMMLGAKRRLAPPLQPWLPEGWYAEPPTPPELLARLGVRRRLAPPDDRLRPEEIAIDLPITHTETRRSGP